MQVLSFKGTRLPFNAFKGLPVRPYIEIKGFPSHADPCNLVLGFMLSSNAFKGHPTHPYNAFKVYPYAHILELKATLGYGTIVI
jgi:hypothetical protein